MLIDFHTHTSASDGSLTPVQLLDYAKSKSVQVMSITDHDTVAAYKTARAYACQVDIRLISGVEFSSYWEQGKSGVHIVGLNIDIDHATIKQAEQSQTEIRYQRAVKIATKLSTQGIPNCLDQVLDIAGESQIGRVHFAQYLQQQGYVDDIKKAFKRYLGNGKMPAIDRCWPSVATVVQWIHSAGGKAVLAHPAKYKMTNGKLRRLLMEFSQSGGTGLEVISAGQSRDVTDFMARLCEEFQLQASVGSDFHRLGSPWQDMGMKLQLPESCEPIWHDWI